MSGKYEICRNMNVKSCFFTRLSQYTLNIRMNKNEIGRNIAKLRKEKGITQQQLSELICISNSYLSAIERGIRKPSVKLMVEIAATLDISIHQIINFLE